MGNDVIVVDMDIVRSRMIEVRGCQVLLDRDVAELYGVQTREVNQAVRNNPDKFPDGYVYEMTREESAALRSKFLTLEKGVGRGRYSKHGYKVFSEKGLYMLATVLKGKRAVQASLAIIETYAQLRSMVRDMEALQTLKDGSAEQAAQLAKTGHKLAALIGDNLSTESTKTTIELNLAVLKITHEVTRTKKRKR
jgi:phage regulator Rha-like protein